MLLHVCMILFTVGGAWSGGGMSAPKGGAWSRGAGPWGLLPEGAWSRGSAPGGVSHLGGAWRRPPGTATAVGGTHPNGMHSCRC